MSKHVSFPAAHLSAYDIGKRIRAITIDGAKVEDTLEAVMAKDDGGAVRIFLQFENLEGHYAMEVDPEQYVKRIDEDA